MLAALGTAFLGPVAAADFDHDPLTIKNGAFQVGDQGESRPLGEMSEFCLACHGQGSTDAPQPAHSLGDPESNHPVDVPYPTATEGYVAVDDLEPRMVLVEGRLTCVTCHDAGARDHATVLSASESQLCLACHDR